LRVWVACVGCVCGLRVSVAGVGCGCGLRVWVAGVGCGCVGAWLKVWLWLLVVGYDPALVLIGC
jgi:hypothetical protein